jgi:protease PrsW
MQLQIAGLGALPALAAMWYFDRLDAKRPEPRSALRRVAIAGALSVIPVAVIEWILMSVAPFTTGYEAAAYSGFVVAGFTEEVAKALCVLLFVYNRPEFDERFDGITYGTRAGLGFALIENVFYLMTAANAEGFLVMFVLRAVLAIPLHAICGATMGYFLAVRRFDKTGSGLMGGLFWAVFLHGAYDAAIFSVPTAHESGNDGLAVLLLAVPLACVIGGVIAVKRMSRTAHARDDADPQVQWAHAQRGQTAPIAVPAVPSPYASFGAPQAGWGQGQGGQGQGGQGQGGPPH